jgi:hypothetical protein
METSHSVAESDVPRKTKGGVVSLAFFLMVGPLCLVLAFFAWTVFAERAGAMACQSDAGGQQIVEGVIRQAGSGFFVESPRWRFIDISCTGKGSGQCMKLHPGIESLAKNIGQAVRVEFCGDHPIAYTVDGQRFVRVGLDEDLLRGKP